MRWHLSIYNKRKIKQNLPIEIKIDQAVDRHDNLNINSSPQESRLKMNVPYLGSKSLSLVSLASLPHQTQYQISYAGSRGRMLVLE